LRRFLFGHMVLDILEKDLNFRVVKLVPRSLPQNFIDKNLGSVMLDLRLIKHFVHHPGFSARRIKKFLFDHRVHN
jgi:hypothetical protein